MPGIVTKRTVLLATQPREVTYHASPMDSIVSLARMEIEYGLEAIHGAVYRCGTTGEILVVIHEDVEVDDGTQ